MMSNLQRTDEWYLARLGRVTASRISDVMARTRSGYGASRANYLAELVVERLTQQPTAGYVSAAMQHGIDTEPDAIAAYQFYYDATVVPVGFVPHPEIDMAGASPDGLLGDDGLIEIKCPSSSTHIDTLLTEKIDGKYLKQMQWQLDCTGRQFCDYASFDPRMPPSMQLFVKRVSRDDKLIAEIRTEVTSFLAELDKTVSALQSKYE